MRILGIDYGSARIGVALGDTETKIASPWRVIVNPSTSLRAGEFDDVIDRLAEIIRQEKVEKIVIGIPRPLGDQSRETDQAREIRVFEKALERLNIPIEEENETFSSALAAGQVEEMGGKGKRDDLAATAILQTFLDRAVSC